MPDVWLWLSSDGGIWSIARGLARNENRYKKMLMACDLPRRNDLDDGAHSRNSRDSS